jgi:hypothetical protein
MQMAGLMMRPRASVNMFAVACAKSCSASRPMKSLTNGCASTLKDIKKASASKLFVPQSIQAALADEGENDGKKRSGGIQGKADE